MVLVDVCCLSVGVVRCVCSSLLSVACRRLFADASYVCDVACWFLLVCGVYRLFVAAACYVFCYLLIVMCCVLSVVVCFVACCLMGVVVCCVLFVVCSL